MTKGEPGPEPEVRLRKITSETVRKICGLQVTEDQTAFVAANVPSIAHGHFEKRSWMRAIYADETPVGFVMTHEEPENGKYYVWRFMVDGRFQGRGFGRRAMGLLISRMRAASKAKTVTLDVVRAPGSAEGFYRRLGFELIGKVHNGEDEMRLDLRGGTPRRVMPRRNVHP
jgi:diamine N-acetyltransferase